MGTREPDAIIVHRTPAGTEVRLGRAFYHRLSSPNALWARVGKAADKVLTRPIPGLPKQPFHPERYSDLQYAHHDAGDETGDLSGVVGMRKLTDEERIA